MSLTRHIERAKIVGIKVDMNKLPTKIVDKWPLENSGLFYCRPSGVALLFCIRGEVMKGEKDLRRAAHSDYIKGMKYKDIADKHGISINTLKSWVKRGGWSEEKKQIKQVKKSAPKKEKGCTPKKKEPEGEVMSGKIAAIEELEEQPENSELNSKEILFCIYYTKYHSKIKAYQKAYKCKYESAHANAWKLWQKKAVRDKVEEMLSQQRQEAKLEAADIFNKFIDIAFADMHDYIKYGQTERVVRADGEPLYTTDENGEHIAITEKHNFVVFSNSDDLDGTIVSEVRQGKDGVSVKLADRITAMKWLGDHLHLATEEQKAHILQMEARTREINAKIPKNDPDVYNRQMVALANLINNPIENRTIEEIESGEDEK